MVNCFSLYCSTTCGLCSSRSYRQTFDSVLEFSESGSMTIRVGPKPGFCINFYCDANDSFACFCDGCTAWGRWLWCHGMNFIICTLSSFPVTRLTPFIKADDCTLLTFDCRKIIVASLYQNKFQNFKTFWFKSKLFISLKSRERKQIAKIITFNFMEFSVLFFIIHMLITVTTRYSANQKIE